MDLEWKEIGFDSNNIERIAHDEVNLYVEFKNNTGYKYENVPYEIYLKILDKELTDKSGKHSHGATFNILVKKAGYSYNQYK